MSDEKYAIPARGGGNILWDIIDKLRKLNKLDDTPFNEKSERIFFYLRHHRKL